MSDEKDRLGDKLHQAERARENQWAYQRDEEIFERLRRKYVKHFSCPQCGDLLDARLDRRATTEMTRSIFKHAGDTTAARSKTLAFSALSEFSVGTGSI